MHNLILNPGTHDPSRNSFIGDMRYRICEGSHVLIKPSPGFRSNLGLALMAAISCLTTRPAAVPAASLEFKPAVEVEENVYNFEPANNGAGPLWCGGSTCLVRLGPDVFASGLETLKDWPPLTNCRWMLFKRGEDGWHKVYSDPAGRTREPSPLAGFPPDQLFVSVNPTLGKTPEPNGGPARPAILQFRANAPLEPRLELTPKWNGQPKFTEHSYRSFAADGIKQELILFQNIGYTHAEWAFRNQEGNWSAAGQLKWPWGAEYDQPEPIRVCYPNVALRNRAVYFCGVSDVVEPYKAWRAYKKELTGREWDYDFRRLFYTYTPDISSTPFKPWLEIASRDKTCGWISPGDLWVGPDGAVHIVWMERAIDERLRARFYPEAKQSHALNYAVVRDGAVASRRTLLEAVEGGAQETPGGARFQVTPAGRLFIIYYVQGRDSAGQAVSENRLVEIYPDGNASPQCKVPLQHPMNSFFTATPRAGSAPSPFLDMLGVRAGSSTTISYARIRLE